MKRFVPGVLAGMFLFLMAGVARAASMESPVIFDNIPNVVAVGIGMVPDYPGSKHYELVPAPAARFTFTGERYIQLFATELNVNVVNHPILRFGPSLNYRFGRSDSVDDDVVKKMEKIDDTVEAGAFFGVVFADARNPRQRFIANVDFLHDIGGTYKGYNVTLNARYWYPISRPIDISSGASTTYADNKYMQTYFGVSQGDSARSGLPVYNASGGMRDVTVSPAVVFHLSRSWHLGAGFRYQRLLGDAQDSPVVKDRGSANQWVYGIAVAYSW